MRLQPTQIGLGTTSTSISTLGLNYTYGTTNNNGNILTQQIIAPNLNTTQSYTYDQVNRLLVAQENSGTNWKQTFTYDVYGNRRFDAANTTTNVLGPNPTISTTNNRINASGYVYDAAGNMTAEPEKSYQYDGENRIKSYNSGAATYHYDGDGRRVKKVVGTVTTLFVYNVAGQMIAEYESPAPSGGGGTSYLTTDHLGSTRVVTDSAGLVKTRRDYLPFGEEIASSIGGRTAAGGYGQADGIDQKFTGKERDAESGLDYFLARYYSSVQGRFTSPDEFTGGPHEFWVLGSGDTEKQALPYAKITNPQSLNKYQYVLNNPLKYVDPDGHQDGFHNRFETHHRQRLKGEITQEQYWERLRGEGVGAIAGLAVVGSVTVATRLVPAAETILVRFAPLLTSTGAALVKTRDNAAQAIERLKNFNLTDVTAQRVTHALNAIKDHITNSDIKGAVQEVAGIATRGDHRKEVTEAVGAIKKLTKSLKGALDNPNLSGEQRKAFEEALNASKELIKAAKEVRK